MSYKVTVDLELCAGYANCLIEAPALFDIDEETDKAIVLNETPGEDQRPFAEAAVRGCPARAIFIKDLE